MVAVLVVRVLLGLLLAFLDFVFVLHLCKLAAVLVVVLLLGCHTMVAVLGLSLRLQE
jgi:hypothetical protein